MDRVYVDVRDAALTLLRHAVLTRKEAGFLGHLTVDKEISWKQERALSDLLKRHGFPPFDADASQ